MHTLIDDIKLQILCPSEYNYASWPEIITGHDPKLLLQNHEIVLDAT